MNPLAIAAAVAAGQYLVEANGGWLVLLGSVKNAAGAASSGASSTTQSATSSPGNNAAVAYLAGLGSVAGIPITVDPQAPSVTSIWTAMQPQVTSSTDGKALATAFLGAFDAARSADSTTYNILNAGIGNTGSSVLDSISTWGGLNTFSPCSTLDSSQLNSLGQAACALSTDRDGYGTGNAWLAAFGVNAGTVDNTQIVTDIATLASEMDAVGYTIQAPGTLDNIEGALGYSLANLNTTIASATQAGLSAIGSAAGSVIGGAASALVGSNLLWAAAFALVAWKVLV